jgi:hypothetical protein
VDDLLCRVAGSQQHKRSQGKTAGDMNKGSLFHGLDFLEAALDMYIVYRNAVHCIVFKYNDKKE